MQTKHFDAGPAAHVTGTLPRAREITAPQTFSHGVAAAGPSIQMVHAPEKVTSACASHSTTRAMTCLTPHG